MHRHLKPISPDETVAIEGCIRSFIIKSIHAIVQGRSGNAYHTKCISDVGARNNLMVYLEEDPEIGATIKQTLDPAFPIKTGDTFSLEILMDVSNSQQRSLVTLEVWQFRVNVEDLLLRSGVPCSKVVANHSGVQPSLSSLPPLVCDSVGALENDVCTVEDFRRSRLFERLGTLLKTVIVTTRLLPAYTYSRNKQPENHQMCYTVRRGEIGLERLGPDVICRQVGHLFPGLAVQGPIRFAGSPVPSLPPDGSSEFDNLLPVFLNVSVRYRAQMVSPLATDNCIEIGQSVPAAVHRNKRSNRIRASSGSSDLHKPPIDSTTQDMHRMNLWVRPAFATNTVDIEPGGFGTDHNAYLLPGTHNFSLTEEDEFPESVSHETGDRENEVDTESSSSSSTPTSPLVESPSLDNSVMSQTFVDHRDSNSDQRCDTPLQLPFSTVGISGARLTNLFAELRKKTDLDIFQVPNSAPTTGSGASKKSANGHPLFNPDALADELERHERTLKEFDDFLTEFTSSVPVGQTQQGSPMRQLQTIYVADLANTGDLY